MMRRSWLSVLSVLVFVAPFVASSPALAGLVITEVYIDSLGVSDIDEHLEIANTGPDAIDLGAYALGTNHDPGVSSEVMRRFPSAVLAPGAVAIVARDGQGFADHHAPPDGTPVFVFATPVGDQLAMGTSVAGWVPGAATALTLSNVGNELLLARDEGAGVWTLVDGVAWGTSTVTSMTPLGGVATPVIDGPLDASASEGQSLARKSANLDTDLRTDWRRGAPTPGFAPFSICGDAVVGDGETCDDGLEVDGDGCSALCQAECGWTCVGAGPASCATDCGDGELTDDEDCDDGNDLPGDGCAPDCTVEPGFVCDDPVAACDGDPETTSSCVIDPCTLPLRITEVHVDGLLDNASEWIELTNAGLIPIDLTAWTVSDQATAGAPDEAAATFPGGAVLGPGMTIVIAHSSEVLGTDFSVGADFEYGEDSDAGVPQLVPSTWAPGGTGLRLANGGDQVVLTCGDVIEDRVAWGPVADALTLPAPSPEYDAGALANGPTTFERLAPELASGTASDFSLSRCPTPGAATNPNRAPDAGPAEVTAAADTTTTIYLPGDDADGDPLTFVLVGAPALGTAVLVSASDGVVEYTPPAGPGPYLTSFTYVVADACARSAPITVTVRVEAATCDPGLADVYINEVHVDAAKDNDGEWIELVNAGPAAVSLASLRVGDEASPGGGEGLFVFPQGATLAAGEVVVLAFSAVAFEAEWGFQPDWEWNRDSNGVADDLRRASTWASGTTRLDNGGDEVVLIGCDGALLDAVYWGVDAPEPAPVAPPWAVRLPAPPAYVGDPGQSPTTLERRDPAIDTDAAADWAVQQCPSPGSASPDDEAPVAADAGFAVTGALFSGALPGSDADLDPLTFTVTAPASGTLTLLDAATGTFEYAPPNGFVGLVTFTFTVSDGCRADTGTITLCVGTSELVGNDVDEDCDGMVTCWVDADGDGYGALATEDVAVGPTGTPGMIGACVAPGRAALGGDCDDDPSGCGQACYPGAREDCNGEDDDCDAGTVDGVQDPALGEACDGDDADLCDDDARVCDGGALACADLGPALVEVCDLLETDDDCDGGADDDDPDGTPANATTFFEDRDGDGYGDDARSEVRCRPSTGFVAVGGDCADDPSGCAADCSPAITESRAIGNCNDGFDNDCDGPADTDPACFEDVVCYADSDGDGYGVTASAITLTGTDAGLGCAAWDDGSHDPGYWVAQGGDCDDDPAACGAACRPGAADLCDGRDNDCVAGTVDGSGDMAVGAPCDSPDDTNLCPDELGVCSGGVLSCPNVATGDAGRVEVCDALDIDEDCDGGADDLDPQGTPAAGTSVFYRDEDGDGRGLTAETVTRCDRPTGYAAQGGDCDDDPTACGAACRPGLIESGGAGNCADTQDNDCDGVTDTDAECFGDVLCYRDRDGDGFGVFATERLLSGTDAAGGCAGYDDGVNPVGSWVANGLDCDDDPAACGAACNPDADDVCDDRDNDCSAATADGADDARVGVACDALADANLCLDDRQACQGGVVSCVDITAGDAQRVERCDALATDEDCDGGADDADPQGSPVDAPLWYRDADGDAFGLTTSAVRRCVAPADHIATGGDCDDDPLTCGDACHPGATELCDGWDNDCLSGTVDGSGDPAVGVACDAPTDQDKCLDEVSVCQGTVTCPNDPDGDLLRIEVCDPDDVDEDCDGEADDDDPEGAGGGTIFRRDRDGDGHGDAGTGGSALVTACDPGPGRVTSADDCDDDPDACGAECAPGLVEGPVEGSAARCDDGYDNDCDGQTDTDEACLSADECFADADGDTFGNANARVVLPIGVASCAAYDDGVHPVGYWVDRAGDCDPGEAAVNPDADEVVGDDVDDDCDGALACWVDADDDEYGADDAAVANAAPGVSCRDAFGLAPDRGDCDDDPTTCGGDCSPAALEVCDTFDNDCDGDSDELAACDPETPDVEFVLDGGSGCAGAGEPAPWLFMMVLVAGLTRRRGSSRSFRRTP